MLYTVHFGAGSDRVRGAREPVVLRKVLFDFDDVRIHLHADNHSLRRRLLLPVFVYKKYYFL